MVNRADLKLLAFGHKGSNPLWSNFMTGDFGKAELLKNKYIFVWKFWFFWNGCRKAADSLRQKKGWFFHRFLVEIFLHKLDSHISHILCVDFFCRYCYIGIFTQVPHSYTGVQILTQGGVTYYLEATARMELARIPCLPQNRIVSPVLKCELKGFHARGWCW